MLEITYTRHLTQLEKNKEWVDGKLVFKGDYAQVRDLNGYVVEVNTHRSLVQKEKQGRFLIGGCLVDIDDDDMAAFQRWWKLLAGGVADHDEIDLLTPTSKHKLKRPVGTPKQQQSSKAPLEIRNINTGKLQLFSKPFKSPLTKAPVVPSPVVSKVTKPDIRHQPRYVYSQSDLTNQRGLIQPLKKRVP